MTQEIAVNLFQKKRKILQYASIVAAFLLCLWLFGWFGGPINVIDFGANEVNSVKVSAMNKFEPFTITEKEDIQTVINHINSFHYSGKPIKKILKEGIGLGGSLLYRFAFSLENDERFTIVLAYSGGEQSLSNSEVSFWLEEPKLTNRFSSMSRGSLEFVYELQQKYVSLGGCSSKDTTIGEPIFETENITSVTFYGSAPNSTETEVPNKYLAEITEWLGTFVVGKKADDVLPPGADSLFVRVEYSDGTIIENSMSTIVVDGATYLINYDKEPECYFELFAK